MNESPGHDILIDVEGLQKLPEASELATALDSWWLLPRLEKYGIAKQSLLDAVDQLRPLTISQWAELTHVWFGAGEAERLLEQEVSDKKIEDVTWEADREPPADTAGNISGSLRKPSRRRHRQDIGKVKHELNTKEKIAELIGLGAALLVYIRGLTEPESQPAVFGMGHKKRELVVLGCKDPSKARSFRANFLSRNAFEVVKEGILELDFLRRYPEICNIEATKFLKSLTKEAGTKEVSFTSPADHLGSVMTALIIGRQDLVLKVNESLAETLEKERVEPSDYDRKAAQILLTRKSKELAEARILDGSASEFNEDMLQALKVLFNPRGLPEITSLPEPVQREVPRQIYALIFLKLRRNSTATFIKMAREAIDELKQSYSWEGLAKHGAAFSDSQLKLSPEGIGEIRQYSEELFAKSGLTEQQTKVLKLEIILCLHGEQEKWSEADKAKYLGMKPGSYRQHLYQARFKTHTTRDAPKELNGYERLLRAIFSEGDLTKS